MEQERRCVRSLPAAWLLLQYPLRAVFLGAVAQFSEAYVCVASKGRIPSIKNDRKHAQESLALRNRLLAG